MWWSRWGQGVSNLVASNVTSWVKTWTVLPKAYKGCRTLSLCLVTFYSHFPSCTIAPKPATFTYCDTSQYRMVSRGEGWWQDVQGLAPPIWFVHSHWSSFISLFTHVFWDLWHLSYLKDMSFARLFYTKSVTWTAVSCSSCRLDGGKSFPTLQLGGK